MRLFQKTANVFFGIIGIIGLFMPLFGYTFTLVSGNYSLYTLIQNAVTSDGDGKMLDAFAKYGYKGLVLACIITFIIGAVLMIAGTVLSFTNVSYIAQTCIEALSFAGITTAMVLFNRFAAAVSAGKIPLRAFSDLVSSSGENGLSDILSNVASYFTADSGTTLKLTLGWGAYACVIAAGVMMIISLMFAIFKKRIFEMENFDEKAYKQAKKEKRLARKLKKEDSSVDVETAEDSAVRNPDEEKTSKEEKEPERKYRGVNPNTSKKKLKRLEKEKGKKN